MVDLIILYLAVGLVISLGITLYSVFVSKDIAGDSVIAIIFISSLWPVALIPFLGMMFSSYVEYLKLRKGSK